MKNIKIIFFNIFLLITCLNCSENIIVNDELTDIIDQYPLSNTRYFITVNSLGKTSDTILIEKIKTDDFGKVLYIEQYFPKNPEIKNWKYFDLLTGEVFYEEEINLESGKRSFYQVVRDKNRNRLWTELISWNQNQPEFKDTMKISYEKTSDDKTRLDKLIGKSQDGSRFKTIFFDKNKNPIQEIELFNGDTTETINLTYNQDGDLVKKIFTSNNIFLNLNIKEIYNYSNKKILNKQTFRKVEKTYELENSMEYFYDSNGNLKKIKLIDHFTNKLDSMVIFNKIG